MNTPPCPPTAATVFSAPKLAADAGKQAADQGLTVAEYWLGHMYVIGGRGEAAGAELD